MRIDLTIDGRRQRIESPQDDVALTLLQTLAQALLLHGVDAGLDLFQAACLQAAAEVPGARCTVGARHLENDKEA